VIITTYLNFGVALGKKVPIMRPRCQAEPHKRLRQQVIEMKKVFDTNAYLAKMTVRFE